MSDRVKGGRGYLMIDNRASGGKLEEYNTLTCGHCGKIVVLNPERKRARGYCRIGNHYVCDGACSIPGTCPNMEKCVELAQLHPGLPTLPRGKEGELLFDPEYLKEGKPY